MIKKAEESKKKPQNSTGHAGILSQKTRHETKTQKRGNEDKGKVETK